MLSIDRARAMAGLFPGYTPEPRLLALYVRQFRATVTREARNFAGLYSTRRQARIWRTWASETIRAFDWRGRETEREAFAAELARVVDEGIAIRRGK